MKIFLMEITYIDAGTLQSNTLRYCSGEQGYMTLPTDAPANAFYEPRIKIPLNFETHILKDGVTGGAATGGFGAAQLLNATPIGGATGFPLDQYIAATFAGTSIPQAFDGQQVRMLWGDSTKSYSTFIPIITGIMVQPEYTWNMMNIKIRDYNEMFQVPLSRYTFLGCNVGGVGVEGTPDDLMGKTKPMCFGHCWNVPCAYVSAANSLFMVHNGPVHSIDAVYAQAAAQTKGTDYPTLALLIANPPANGVYNTCLAMGIFSLGGSGATSQITADVQGDATGGAYVNTIAGICKRIMQSYIQKPRYNRLQYSEAFSNSIWTPSNAVIGSYSGNMPMIGMGGASLSDNSTSGVHSLTQTINATTGMYCFSCFVKPQGSTLVRLQIAHTGSTANNCLIDFDLVGGQILQQYYQSNGNAVGPQYMATGFVTKGGMTLFPNGWWRLWVTGQPDTTFSQIGASIVCLNGTTSSYNFSYTGSGAVQFLVAGAMFEQTNSASIYTGPSTNTAVNSDIYGNCYAIGYDPILGPTLNTASFTALDAQVPYEVGFSTGTGDTTAASDAMDTLLRSAGCFRGQDRSGNIFVGQFTKPLPTATPVAYFNSSNSIQDTMQRVAPFSNNDGTPAYRTVISAVQNYTVQKKADVPSSMWIGAPMRVAWLNDQYRQAIAEDSSMLFLHPLACEIDMITCLSGNLVNYTGGFPIINYADAYTEAARLLALYRGRLDRYTFTVKLDQAYSLYVGQIINIAISRWTLTNGQNFCIIGITEQHEFGHTIIEVLG